MAKRKRNFHCNYCVMSPAGVHEADCLYRRPGPPMVLTDWLESKGYDIAHLNDALFEKYCAYRDSRSAAGLDTEEQLGPTRAWLRSLIER